MKAGRHVIKGQPAARMNAKKLEENFSFCKVKREEGQFAVGVPLQGVYDNS